MTPPLQPTLTHRRALRTTMAIALLLFLVRIPFLAIHHVQEDAYITFRTARHLAEQGDFSYNLGGHFPATTSLLYPLAVALIDLAARGYLVLSVQVFGILCAIAASYLAARALCERQGPWQAAWLLLGCWPVSLVASYTGMETPLLLLALGAAMYGFRSQRHPALFAWSLAALPLIRPDALAYGLVFCAAMWLLDRAAALRGGLALTAGAGLLLLGNRLTAGQWLPTTARAKEIAYHPSHAPIAVVGRLYEVFLHQSFLLPVSTSYLTRLSPLLLLLTVGAFAAALRTSAAGRERALLGALAVLSVAVPTSYAYGGVIFDWYLFPVNWLAAAVVIAVGTRRPPTFAWPRLAWALVAVVWVGLGLVQWTRSLAASTEDYHYRGDIGRYLGEISHGQGTLFLEPAGYIPYYSGLSTDDEVGLVSNKITGYMLRDPNRASGDWWIQYVEAERPTYLVERGSFAHDQTLQGYTLTASERRWFDAHYRLLRRTSYEPRLYHPSPLLRRILAMSGMPDYLVYRRND